ncbi:MAG: hypothetical protein ACRCXT_03010 [Paraclostridium sp.]
MSAKIISIIEADLVSALMEKGNIKELIDSLYTATSSTRYTIDRLTGHLISIIDLGTDIDQEYILNTFTIYNEITNHNINIDAITKYINIMTKEYNTISEIDSVLFDDNIFTLQYKKNVLNTKLNLILNTIPLDIDTMVKTNTELKAVCKLEGKFNDNK